MKKDVLLDQFKSFELSNSQIQTIMGGVDWVTGCRQNGSESYEDWLIMGTPWCDIHVSSNDNSGWCVPIP